MFCSSLYHNFSFITSPNPCTHACRIVILGMMMCLQSSWLPTIPGMGSLMYERHWLDATTAETHTKHLQPSPSQGRISHVINNYKYHVDKPVRQITLPAKHILRCQLNMSTGSWHEICTIFQVPAHAPISLAAFVIALMLNNSTTNGNSRKECQVRVHNQHRAGVADLSRHCTVSNQSSLNSFN